MRNNYRATSWLEWATTGAFILIVVPLGLACAGFFAKALFNCFMAGWSLI